jgi:PHD/YefM family antitoxin component YafN of YafNO toxin-antitoxin module
VLADSSKRALQYPKSALISQGAGNLTIRSWRRPSGTKPMRRISSADLVRNFSVHSDAALSEPVVITRNGRDRLVLMNTERYHELLAAYSRSERQGRQLTKGGGRSVSEAFGEDFTEKKLRHCIRLVPD